MEVFLSILMLLLLSHVYEKTEACTCTSQANRTSICSADFGLKAKVTNTGDIVGENKVYEIVPLMLYHLPDFPFETKEQEEKRMKEGHWSDCSNKHIINRFDVDFFRIYTAQNEEECGVKLEHDTEYILTGNFDASFQGPPKRLRVEQCDWVEEWDSLTDDDIVFISYPDKCY